MIDAYPATLASSLGLRSKDLAEIGGFSDRYARDVLAGRAGLHIDVVEALELLQDDVEVIADKMEAMIEEGRISEIEVFRTNEQLREQFPQWPVRGKSGGGFVGPHRIAAIEAWHNTGAKLIWAEG